MAAAPESAEEVSLPLPPSRCVYVIITPGHRDETDETPYAHVSQTLIKTGWVLLRIASLPVDLYDLVDIRVRMELPAHVSARHSVTYIFEANLNERFFHPLERYPFVAIFDARQQAAGAVPTPTGHVHVTERTGDVARRVLDAWRKDAIQAVERIRRFWPPEAVAPVAEFAARLSTQGIARPVATGAAIPNRAYLQPNAYVRNLAAGLWAEDMAAALVNVDPKTWNDVPYIQSEQAKLAEDLVQVGAERRSFTPEAVLVAPSVNPHYLSGVEGRLRPAGAPAGPVNCIVNRQGYQFVIDSGAVRNERAAALLAGAIRLRAEEIEWIDSVATCRASARWDAVFRTPHLPGRLFGDFERLAGFRWDPGTIGEWNRRWTEFSRKLTESVGRTVLEWIRCNCRAVVAYSDLPIEWCLVGDVPLGYVLPVTRIPLAPGNAPVLPIVDYRPPSLWITKQDVPVLVVNGHMETDEMYEHPQIVARVARGAGFNVSYEEVRSEQELFAAIDRDKPRLLYLSAHGTMTEKGAGVQLAGDPVTFGTLESLPYAPDAAIVSACRSDAVVRTYGSPASRLFLGGVRSVLGSYLNLTEPHASLIAAGLIGNLAGALEALPGTERLGTWREVVFHTLRSRRPIDVLAAVERRLVRRGRTGGQAFELFQRFTQWHNKERDYGVEGSWSGIPERLISLAEDDGDLCQALRTVVATNAFRAESMFYTHIGQPERILVGPRWERIRPRA